jgi:hypothetical protein
MICRRVVWVLGALALAPITPAEAHAQPPTQCLTNTALPRRVVDAGVEQIAGNVDLLASGGVGPLDEYAPDVRAWCG